MCEKEGEVAVEDWTLDFEGMEGREAVECAWLEQES